MYISVDHLHKSMGVDASIARFFIDRRVPAENIFWRNRLLYIGRGNGYISIPVYYDILFRIGISKDVLLDEKHIVFMEKLMHDAIRVEYQEISFNEQLENIKALLKDRVKNPDFYQTLTSYLSQPVLKPKAGLGMDLPSLNRADVFLFILTDLPLTKEQTSEAVKFWYALHSSYLIMDDIYDYKKDKEGGEENAVIQFGDSAIGFEKSFDFLAKNREILRPLNPLLADHFKNMSAGLDALLPDKY